MQSTWSCKAIPQEPTLTSTSRAPNHEPAGAAGDEGRDGREAEALVHRHAELRAARVRAPVERPMHAVVVLVVERSEQVIRTARLLGAIVLLAIEGGSRQVAIAHASRD